MPASALRPRSVTEIVDVTFQIYRTHFATLVMCTALAYLPALVVRALFAGDAARILAGQAVEARTPVAMSLLAALLAILSYALMSALLAICTSQIYLGETVDVRAALRHAVARLPAVIGATVLVAMIIGVGMLLLIAPGLYAAALLFAVIPLLVIEDRGVFASFARSGVLSQDRKWHILLTVGLTFLIYLVVLLGLSLVVGLLAAAVGFAGGVLLQTVFSSIVTICIYPIIPITTVLLYYDARIQSEGLDIELLTDALAAAPAPATP